MLIPISVQGALQWLEDNQDKSLENIQAAITAKEEEDNEDEDETKARIAELESGQGRARSLVCNDCGKLFRNQDLASYHASKTYVLSPLVMMPSTNCFSDHTDFSESTQEIAPLTAEEKKAKLVELRERLQAKKALQSVQEKEDQKRNEVCHFLPSRHPLPLTSTRKSDKRTPRKPMKPRKNSPARNRSRKPPARSKRSSKTRKPRDASRPKSKPTRPSVVAKQRKPRLLVRVEHPSFSPPPPRPLQLPSQSPITTRRG